MYGQERFAPPIELLLDAMNSPPLNPHLMCLHTSQRETFPSPSPCPPPCRTSAWRSLVAGAVAGQMLALTGSETRHDSLATYVLLRGLTLLVRTANKPQADPTLRWLLTPTRMKWVTD